MIGDMIFVDCGLIMLFIVDFIVDDFEFMVVCNLLNVFVKL